MSDLKGLRHNSRRMFRQASQRGGMTELCKPVCCGEGSLCCNATSGYGFIDETPKTVTIDASVTTEVISQPSGDPTWVGWSASMNRSVDGDWQPDICQLQFNERSFSTDNLGSPVENNDRHQLRVSGEFAKEGEGFAPDSPSEDATYNITPDFDGHHLRVVFSVDGGVNSGGDADPRGAFSTLDQVFASCRIDLYNGDAYASFNGDTGATIVEASIDSFSSTNTSATLQLTYQQSRDVGGEVLEEKYTVNATISTASMDVCP